MVEVARTQVSIATFEVLDARDVLNEPESYDDIKFISSYLQQFLATKSVKPSAKAIGI